MHATDRRVGPLLTFFALSFGVMWALFLAVAVWRIPPGSPLGYGMILLGAFAPGISALVITSRTEGSAGVSALIGQIFRPAQVRWFVFGALFMTGVRAIVAVTHRVASGEWPAIVAEPWVGIVAAIVFLAPFQAGEELGWRGYALPRLIERFGFARASLLLGLIWSVWHLPQFFIAGGGSYGQPFPHFVIQATAISIVMSWLYVRSGGNLLAVMLMHSGVNNTWRFVPAPADLANTFGMSAPRTVWMTAVILWAAAILVTHGRPRDGDDVMATT